MLEALPAGQDAAAVEPASQYQGAHVQLAGSAPHANLILAFEYPGGWRDIQVCGLIVCYQGTGIAFALYSCMLGCGRQGFEVACRCRGVCVFVVVTAGWAGCRSR
jgi:hypothetical protein